ncbi:MAG: phosphoglucosamine mutase [Bacteroidales bacterium]
MTLIKSISGIRGTIGGLAGESLTPLDVVKFSSAFACFLKKRQENKAFRKLTMVVGRDARISGPMVDHLVVGSLLGMGVEVINVGLSTTPTVEMAVLRHKAQGGIIITASHNPMEWNALKLLDENGEFISAEQGEEVIALSESGNLKFAEVANLGHLTIDTEAIEYHINKVLDLKRVEVEAIRRANFTVVVDGINSTGGIAIPLLLKALGVSKIIELYTEPTGVFAHNPEPLPDHLKDLSLSVLKNGADLGISVDPDVDRLAFVCENGKMFGEEYTLVSVADYILSKEKGPTVSNMSSSRALKDISEKWNCSYSSAAVGEVHVVTEMKAKHAVIGGEGNGGVIYPELHYGRDALVGTALFLTYFAHKKENGIKNMSDLRASLPNYFISKNKISISSQVDVNSILHTIQEKYREEKVSDIDGVKIEFEKEKEWVQLRKSNTEPILRVYAESNTKEKAECLAGKIISEIKKMK